MTDNQLVENNDGSWSLWVDSELGLVEVVRGTYNECVDWSFNTSPKDEED